MFTVIRKRKGSIKGYYNKPTMNQHRQEILFFAFFFVGLTLGAIAIRKNSSLLLDRLLSLFQNYSIVKADQSAPTNFCNALFRQILMLLCAFCMGLCAVGQPFLYFLPFGYGLGIGVISAFLYKNYMLKGIGYCALILFPAACLSVTTLIFSCSVGAEMSRRLMKGLLHEETENERSFRIYCLRFLTAAAVSAAAALIETALYALFSRYFQFS